MARGRRKKGYRFSRVRRNKVPAVRLRPLQGAQQQNWTQAEFLHEYARNPEWQYIGRQKGWDNGSGDIPTGFICALCCFIASCCDNCSCGCGDSAY